MQIDSGAPGELYESAGHSTNFAKLYRNASLTGYSTLSPFSQRAPGKTLKKSQQTMIKEKARGTLHASARAKKLPANADRLSLRFRSGTFIIAICIQL